jgi:hypothetical protein
LDKPTEAIADLLQERLKFEQWLAALESRRATTSPTVYSRVRADYEARLARVLDDLSGRTSDLRALVDSLSGQVAGLQAEEAAKRDLQSEAELRAAVGEYSADQWRQFSQAGQAEIARIMARRADTATELAQVQQLLTMASTRRPGLAVGGAMGAAPPSAVAAPVAAVPAAPVLGAAPAGDGGLKQSSFDELAFLHSVVEPKSDSARPAPVASASQAKAQPAPAASPPPPPLPPPPAPPTQAPRPAAADTAPASTAPAVQVDTAEVVPDPDAPPVPSFLRDVPLEQVKTLKCAECGTMNFATEWYCERCGGELAAM